MPELTVCRGCGTRFWSASWAYCDYCRAVRMYSVNEDELNKEADEALDEAIEWEALLAGETLDFDDGCPEEGYDMGTRNILCPQCEGESDDCPFCDGLRFVTYESAREWHLERIEEGNGVEEESCS